MPNIPKYEYTLKLLKQLLVTSNATNEYVYQMVQTKFIPFVWC